MASRDYSRSEELWTRASRLVPGGTHTISKRVDRFADAHSFPAFLRSAQGARVRDVDGNEYIDYIAALGPIILGYSHPAVDEAIRRQLEDGVLFSLPPPIEVELVERLTRILPCAEMVRLFKTGAEATSAAVRACRAATGREIVLSCDYQGWHDWWAVKEQHKGIPVCLRPLTVNLPFGDTATFLESLRQHGDQLAAVILTPALYGCHPPPGFLETIREETIQRGIPLVFDEIITGFRWGIGGAQAHYGVVPDLATYGKAVANGMPLAFLAGNATLMEHLRDNWVTSTYSSEALSIAAAMATLDVLEQESVHARLYEIAEHIQSQLSDISKRLGIQVVQGDCLPALTFGFRMTGIDQSAFDGCLIRQCAANGVLVRRHAMGFSLCLIAALADADIERTMEVLDTSVQAALGKTRS